MVPGTSRGLEAPRVTVPFFDLSRQARMLESRLLRSVGRVLRGGRYILGREVDRFEKGFARFHRVQHAVGVASGTDALELALRALGVGPGDRVATVSWTFVGTVDAIRHAGAQPLFVDIDPRTFCMDPDDLERRVRGLGAAGRRHLKAVVPVHLFGHPCDMTAIGRVARRFRLAVVEDAAQAAGAAWKGRPVGGFGQAGAFSFFPTKPLGGFGDGGMVVTGSRRLAERIRRLRVHGRDRRGRPVELGRNSRLDALQAALLSVKLPLLRHALRLRRRLAAAYTRALSGLPEVLCPSESVAARHAFALYVIRAGRRSSLRAFLSAQGIETKIYYAEPVHRQSAHRAGAPRPPLVQTERAAREVLALPLYPEMHASHHRKVTAAVRAFYRRRGGP